MSKRKPIVIKDSCDDMLSIEYNGKSLFYGNSWDFHRDVSTFKELFQKLGFAVETGELPCEDEEETED